MMGRPTGSVKGEGWRSLAPQIFIKKKDEREVSDESPGRQIKDSWARIEIIDIVLQHGGLDGTTINASLY